MRPGFARPRPRLRQLAVLAIVAAAPPAPAAEKEKPAHRDEPSVSLSPFAVNGHAAAIGRYALLESISAGRVRIDIMDSSQGISVLAGEVIEDVAAGRIVEATRFIAGVTDATLPTSWEFSNLRGFLAEGRTVDGITYGAYPSNGFQNIDPAIIERIEVVKGPNSILAPQPTSPGGTVNLATKQPQFRDFGEVGGQWGRFDANGGFIDVNRQVGDRFAFRFIGAARDCEHWWRDAWVRSTTLMPEFTCRFSANTQATVQYTYTDWRAQNYFGLPIDPAAGTTTSARLLSGVPRDRNVFNADVARATRQHELKLLFTADLGRGIQMRLVAACNTSSQDGPQINTGPSTGGPGGNVDPLTGFWNSGRQYLPVAPYASSPLASPPTRIFTRSGVELVAEPRQFNLQNDYALLVERAAFKSTTLAGFACTDRANDNSTAYNLTVAVPTFDIDHPVGTAWTRGPINYSNRTASRFTQAYVSENVALLGNRLILNAAGSWQHYDDRVESRLAPVRARATQHTALPSYGVVLKPVRDALSLYYSRTEQSSSNGVSTTASVPPLATSRQDEFGARFKSRDGGLYFTVAHYVIGQINFATPNPANLAVPPPTPLLPNLYLDREARGWEYELRAQPVRGLSLIASYTHFRNRDLNGVEFRGVAEKAGGLLASYAFDRRSVPVLDGFRVAIGLDTLGRRPGDNQTGAFTVASTPDRPIPNQPTFYLDARTLVHLTLAYDPKRRWGIQVNIDNALDRDYVQASVTRFAVFPGPPRNVRVSMRYGF